MAALIAALAPFVVSKIEAANQRRDQIAKVARQHLRGASNSSGIDLPLVADLTLDELGVHRAVVAVPYIRRDQEAEIRKFLEAGEPVLVVGSSMVGKTMMAASVIKATYGAKKLVAPDSKDALASLAEADLKLREVVIWLDDINLLIGARVITANTLRRLVADNNIVIATIRALAYDRYMPSSGVQSQEWDTLRIFQRVFINKELSPLELERVESAVDDEVVKARISRVGLGEYVGAAQQIEENLRLGSSVSPLGYAILQGAADWRRAGIDRPVPGSLLAELATPYLVERKRHEILNPADFAEAMSWATREINEQVSLLQPMGRDSFSIFDYALDFLAKAAAPFPAGTWDLVIGVAEPPELLSVGYAAWVTYDIFEPALKAWSKAAESTDLDVRPRAIFNIAHMLQFQDRLDEAEVMYERAIDSGNPEMAAIALTDLGYMKFKQGRIDDAKQDYERVLGSVDNPWAISLTHLRLGMLSEMGNDFRASYEWYDLAQRSGFYELMPQAALGLAHVALKEDFPLSARAHFQKAINSGHAIYEPVAAFELAKLLIRFDQVEEACEALRTALNAWNDEVSPPAAGLLGQLLEATGRIDAARAAYTTAVESGHPEAAPVAALLLGKLLEQQGDLDAALGMYRKAMKSSIEEVSAEATAQVERLIGRPRPESYLGT
jgi:tetratricopeptide (TPR) repeat protein